MPTEDMYPGVYVIERPFPDTRNLNTGVVNQGAFIGKSVQGPTAVTQVTSWRSFTTLYGTAYTDLHNAVYDYFNNGGRTALIVRLAGTGATSASVTVPIAGSDPPETLWTVTATNPGVWGNQLKLVAYERDATNYRFDLALYKVPTGVTFDPSIRNTSYMVEQWADLSLDPDDPRYVYDVVNAPAASGSQYITISGLSHSSSSHPMPAFLTAFSLASGTDGSYTTGWTATTAYQAAIDSMVDTPGPFVLNLPGVSDSTILRYAVQNAANRGDVFVVVDPPSGTTTPAEAISFLNSTLALNTLGDTAPSYAALYYPWLYLPAVGKSANKQVLRGPGGAIIGMMMATDRNIGPWKAAAGLKARVAGAVAPARILTGEELASLNNNHVNAIRSIPGAGVVVMGARTAKKYALDRYVNVRRCMIFIRESLRRQTEFALFEQNDFRLWAQLEATCDGFLSDFWARGGLRGRTKQEAFYVVCDERNNSYNDMVEGVVNIEVGVALTAPAEFVIITINHIVNGVPAA